MQVKHTHAQTPCAVLHSSYCLIKIEQLSYTSCYFSTKSQKAMLNWSSKILKRIQGTCLQGIWQLHKTSWRSLSYYTVCNSIRMRPFVFHCYVFCQATSKTESHISFCLFSCSFLEEQIFFLFHHCTKMYSVTTSHHQKSIRCYKCDYTF